MNSFSMKYRQSEYLNNNFHDFVNKTENQSAT